MKNLLAGAVFGLVAGGFVSAASAEPAAYIFDKSHAHITFAVSHLGFSTTHGEFRDFDGTLTLDEADPAASSVAVTIQTGSIDSAWEARDEHLRGPDFFDVANHPAMTFKSTAIEVTGDNTAKMTGDLTLLGVTKAITLDVALNQLGEHPFSKKMHAGFTATGSIDRAEYGMTYGVPAVGQNVAIRIDIEAQKAE